MLYKYRNGPKRQLLIETWLFNRKTQKNSEFYINSQENSVRSGGAGRFLPCLMPVLIVMMPFFVPTLTTGATVPLRPSHPKACCLSPISGTTPVCHPTLERQLQMLQATCLKPSYFVFVRANPQPARGGWAP